MSELESNVHAPDKNIQKFQETRLQNLKLLKAQVRRDPTKSFCRGAPAGLFFGMATCFSCIEFSFVAGGSRLQP